MRAFSPFTKKLICGVLAAINGLYPVVASAEYYLIPIPGLRVRTGTPLTVTNTNLSNTSSTSVRASRAILKVAPSTVDFGTVSTGLASSIQTVTLRNLGSEGLMLGALSSDSQFSVTNNCDGVALPPLAECQVNIAFSPTQIAADTVTGKIHVPFTAGAEAAVAWVDVQGTTAPPPAGTAQVGSIEVSPPDAGASAPAPTADGTPVLAFSTAIINQQSLIKTITLSSNGDKPLGFNGLAIAQDDGSFTATSDCPAEVPVGSQCTITVTFAPKTVGYKDQVLHVATTSYTGNDMPVQLTGEAIEVYAVYDAANSTKSVDMGTAVQGGAAVTKDVKIYNSGTAPMTVGALTFSGTATGLSVQSTTCDKQVPVNDYCTVTLAMAASAITTLDAQLVVPHNGRMTPTSPVSIPVKGQVVAQTRVLSYSTTLDFGPSDVNTAYSKDLSIKNTGNSPVSGISAAIPTPFTAGANTCTSTLAPNATCTITLNLNYGTTGPLSKTLTVTGTSLTSAAPSVTVTAAMQTRTIAALSPSTLAFGLQTTQAWSDEMQVTVTNTGSVRQAPYVGNVLGDSTISGQSWLRVSSSTCAAGVDPGKSCTIGFQVKPSSAVAFSTTVNVYPDAGLTTRQQALTVTATGVPQGYTISTSALNYGTVGSLQYADQTVTFTNISQAGTTVTGLTYSFTQPTLTGATSAGTLAVQANTCTGGTTIPSQSSCALTIRYTAPSLTSTTAVVPTGGKFSVRFTGARSVDSVLPASMSVVGSDVTVTANNTDFGDVPAMVPPASSPRRVLTVKNTGAYSVTYKGYTIDSTNSMTLTEDTTPANRCIANSTLAAGASCTVTLYPLMNYNNNPVGGAKTTGVTVQVVSLGNSVNAGSQINFTANALPASVSTSVSTLDFGLVGENTKVTKTFTFQSTNGGQIALTSAPVTGTGYSLTTTSTGCAVGQWVAPSTVCTWTIQLDQKAYSTATVPGTVSIVTNTNGQTNVTLATVNLTAQIERAAVQVAYNDLNWGDVPTQTAGTIKYAVLKNTSTVAVVPFTGKSVATPFTISTATSSYTYQGLNLANCVNMASLGTGVSCYIGVSLSGATASNAGTGAFSGPVTITTSGADSTIAVPMTANFLNANPVTDTASVTFPNPTPTTTTHTPDMTVTVTNTGGGRMLWRNALGYTYSFFTTGDFYIVNYAGVTSQSVGVASRSGSTRCEDMTQLDAGQSCTLTIRFIPTGTAGTKTSTLTIGTYSPSYQNIAIPLTGTAQAGVMSVSDTTIDFGKVVVGTSLVKSFTISNQGNSALSLSNLQRIRSDGAAAQYPTELAATHNCPTSLNPGDSCQVNVTFAPDQNLNWGSLTNKEAFQFKHYTNGVWATTTIPLIGEGYGSQLTADIHTQALGAIEQVAGLDNDYDKTITFTASGPGSVRITGLSLAAGTYLEVYAGGTCVANMTLQSGESCTLKVRNIKDFSNSTTYPLGALASKTQQLFTINGSYYNGSTMVTNRAVVVPVTGTIVSPMTLVEASPRAVSTLSTTLVSLFGTNFRTGVVSQLDGNAWPNTRASSTELRASTPSNLSGGTHTIAVKNMDGVTRTQTVAITASNIAVNRDTAQDVYTAMYDRPVEAKTYGVHGAAVLSDGRKVILTGDGVLRLYDTNDRLITSTALPLTATYQVTAWRYNSYTARESYLKGNLVVSGNSVTVAVLGLVDGTVTSDVSCINGVCSYDTSYYSGLYLHRQTYTVGSGFSMVGGDSPTLVYSKSGSASKLPYRAIAVQAITVANRGSTSLIAYTYVPPTDTGPGTLVSNVRLWSASAGTPYTMATQSGNALSLGAALASDNSAYVRWGDRIYTYSVASSTTLTGGVSYQYAGALGTDTASGLALGTGGGDLITSCYGNSSVCVISAAQAALGSAYLLSGSGGTSTGYVDGAYADAQFNLAAVTANDAGATVYQASTPNALRVVKWAGGVL